jgi:chorismate mutase
MPDDGKNTVEWKRIAQVIKRILQAHLKGGLDPRTAQDLLRLLESPTDGK